MQVDLSFFPTLTRRILMASVLGLLLAGAPAASRAQRAEISKPLPPAPPIDTLRATLIRNFSLDQSAVLRFQHVERVTEVRDGKAVTKTQRVWYAHGRPVSEVTAYGNQPLSPARQRAEHQKAMQREQELLQRTPPPVGVLEFNHKIYPFWKLAQDFVYGPGKTIRWDHRVVWVYPAEPNPNAPNRSREEEILLSSRGQIWVDAQDLHVIRISIHTFEPVKYWLGFLATVHSASLELDLERQAPGVWLPQKAAFAFRATVLLFKKLARSRTQIYSDYVPKTAPEAGR